MQPCPSPRYAVAPPSEDDADRILCFWHQVEFFIPFDLQRQVIDPGTDKKPRHLVPSPATLWSCPQLGQPQVPLWEVPILPDRRLIGFDVYMGVFDKSVLAKEMHKTLETVSSPQNDWETEERCDLEGLTCIAKFKTDSQGVPLPVEVSVSTAPWALGRLRYSGGQLSALDFDEFRHSITSLKTHLNHALRRPANHTESGEALPADTPLPLTGEELLGLLSVFQAWAGFPSFSPESPDPVIVIQAKTIPQPSEKASQPNPTTNPNKKKKTEDTEGEQEDTQDDEIEVDILNSFFANDIARVIRSRRRGKSSPALEAYLATPPAEARFDLYGENSHPILLRTLTPARLPMAHWPDEPDRVLSLMQQFSINSLLEKLETGGIFSVNGPPGTGKTTLLRDVFAELLTRRARVLAGFTHAQEALDERVTISFGGDTQSIRPLRPELTGFEMVVASSNNAAVENISRDLPKSASLGKTWRNGNEAPQASYLQPVAHNIAARKSNGAYKSLTSDEVPWGLIACVLGQKRNRAAFAQGLLFHAGPTKGQAPGSEKTYHTLWTWRTAYQGPSFASARKTFLRADEAVRKRIDALDRYAELSRLLGGHTASSFAAEAVKCVEQTRQNEDTARSTVLLCTTENEHCERQLADLCEEARLVEQGRLPRWLRWLPHGRDRSARLQLAENRKRQQEWLERKRTVQSTLFKAKCRLIQAENEHAQARQVQESKEREWRELAQEHQTLAKEFPQAEGPASDGDLEAPHRQVVGLWRDDTLNRLRSELFLAGLALHQAWLAEVLQSQDAFGRNVWAIGQLLSGKRPDDSTYALPVWQSLFMIVPVISSTFASLSSQFCDLGPDSLGWLFMDEAGQAIPQAAVGALWRARRAVAVGDPLQIEPVYTVPRGVIDALARKARLPQDRRVEPHLASVQYLADQANELGAMMDDAKARLWIGCPLRVHRRCVDPMFRLANSIAYHNTMIFFAPGDTSRRLPPSDSLDLGPSAWVDIGGEATEKQVVEEQIKLVGEAVGELYQRTGELPPLYIISPFRRIKDRLSAHLQDPATWTTADQPTTTRLREWCKTRIGTVHTFQGKEESMVWMVLGCDARTEGAARWASEKPNLLNVALTRARHRFFLIGQENLWGALPHFSLVTPELLPRIRPDEFRKRARGESASPVL